MRKEAVALTKQGLKKEAIAKMREVQALEKKAQELQTQAAAVPAGGKAEEAGGATSPLTSPALTATPPAERWRAAEGGSQLSSLGSVVTAAAAARRIRRGNWGNVIPTHSQSLQASMARAKPEVVQTQRGETFHM